jgi:hypothetical protein
VPPEARLCSTSCWLLYPEPIWEYRLAEKTLSQSVPALRTVRVLNASVCCTRTTVNVLVWPKISKQTVWESLEFKNSGCLGRDTYCWVSGLNFLRITALILKSQVDRILPGHLEPWGKGPYISSKHHHRLQHHIPADRNPHLHYSQNLITFTGICLNKTTLRLTGIICCSLQYLWHELTGLMPNWTRNAQSSCRKNSQTHTKLTTCKQWWENQWWRPRTRSSFP